MIGKQPPEHKHHQRTTDIRRQPRSEKQNIRKTKHLKIPSSKDNLHRKITSIIIQPPSKENLHQKIGPLLEDNLHWEMTYIRRQPPSMGRHPTNGRQPLLKCGLLVYSYLLFCQKLVILVSSDVNKVYKH